MTKKLTIRDEVYAKLVSIKGKDESFSELFERLMEGQSLSEILKALRGRGRSGQRWKKKTAD